MSIRPLSWRLEHTVTGAGVLDAGSCVLISLPSGSGSLSREKKKSGQLTHNLDSSWEQEEDS